MLEKCTNHPCCNQCPDIILRRTAEKQKHVRLCCAVCRTPAFSKTATLPSVHCDSTLNWMWGMKCLVTAHLHRRNFCLHTVSTMTLASMYACPLLQLKPDYKVLQILGKSNWVEDCGIRPWITCCCAMDAVRQKKENRTKNWRPFGKMQQDRHDRGCTIMTMLPIFMWQVPPELRHVHCPEMPCEHPKLLCLTTSISEDSWGPHAVSWSLMVPQWSLRIALWWLDKWVSIGATAAVLVVSHSACTVYVHRKLLTTSPAQFLFPFSRIFFFGLIQTFSK